MDGGGDVSTVGSSADKIETMDAQSLSTGEGVHDTPNRISSTGADDESENDELTIDDSCVNNEDMEEDNDNNVAIVSSSTLHQMNEDDDEDDDALVATSADPEAVSVSSKPLHIDEDEPMENENDTYASEQSMVSTTTSDTVSQNSGVTVTTQIQNPPENSDRQELYASSTKGNEDDDVDIDGVEEAVDEKKQDHPASPDGPESPPLEDQESLVDNPRTLNLPVDVPADKSSDDVPSNMSPPKVVEESTPKDSLSSEKAEQGSPRQSSQTSEIMSQDNFSQFDTSGISLSTITSQSSSDRNESSKSQSQESVKSANDCSMDEDTLDGSQAQTSTQSGNSPSASEMENDESQQSSIVASEKSASNGNVPKSRSKSRSRSNTDDQDDDVDLEDGEIMDDEEEEVKAVAIPPPKEKKEKETKPVSKSHSSSSSTKEKSSSEKEKEKIARDKDKEKEREKDKHRKDKKRSKRDEEKEKEKESGRKHKKRKASDAGESEQEEYLFVRGASPGSAAPPVNDVWSSAVVEEFGDDSKVSRAKRRRESDGDGSPTHHHHHASNRPVREPSPPRRGGMDNNARNKRPVREERKEPKSDVICAYFMQGKCQKSAMECSFSHDAVPPRKMELCKFWMMECCAKKEKCLYLHNDFPCKFYHTGLICKAGDRCKFSHSALSEVTKQVLLKHIETAPKEILGDFPRLNRQGAINLINKMEARMRGEKVDDDKDGFGEMNQMEHHGRGHQIPPPHERHHPHGHNRNEERHQRGGRDHHGGHGGGGHPHAHGHHGHGNPRGNNNDVRGGGGRGDDRHHNNNNNRNSRWEQSHIQPTRDDQEKLQELMHEAGISGFYKDTLETGMQPPVTQGQGPPGSFPPGMQPPLLPLNPVLMSQIMPGLMPQNQGNTVNNPALANVLASLNIPSTSIVPPTTMSQMSTPPNIPPLSNPSQVSDDSNLSSDGKTVPDHLPKMQQELFMRIQKQQQKNENKMQKMDKSEPEEQEENWYSSEDEEDTKKKDAGSKSKTEISDKISSVLNQIRAQSQPQVGSSSPSLPSSLPLPPVSDSKPPSFYGDTDFRSQPPSFKDIDLRNPASIFKKIEIEPAKEINASLTHNGPMIYKVRKVAGIPKIDYSSVRMGLPPSSVLLDPRLGPKRNNNSMPAPASPTETSAPDSGIQPLTIPDGTPVFDPRTMRGGGGPSTAGRGIPPQQNNPFLDSDNRFSSLPSLPNPGLSDFPLFNRDPRGLGGGDPRGGPNPGGAPGSGTQAQMAAMAAAMAAMQHQLPNMPGQGGMDPNLLMLGFPFLPQNPGGGGGGGGMDFQQMMPGGGPGGNMRMRPPFSSHQSASSSWERMNQGPQGQGRGDVTPPL